MHQEHSGVPAPLALHPALEVLEDGFCTLDPQCRVTYWNAAAERLLLRPRQEVLGRLAWDALPLFRDGAARNHLLALAAGSGPRRFRAVCPPEAGGAVLAIHAARAADGSLVVHLRDTTAEVRREGRYADLLESIRDGFIAVDAHWHVVYLNPVAESLLRLPRDRAIGASLWALLPDGPEEIRECLRATMDDGMQRHLREIQPQGRVFRGRVFDLRTYPLSGGGISVLLEDVSERVQRERELARFAAVAEEANQAKSRFFAAISHELRTPLNAIVGYTHLLSAGTYGEIPEGAMRAAHRASVCAEHLARLVDDVLLLTSAEIGRLPVVPCAVDLAGYLPSILEPVRLQAEAKGLEFSVQVAPGVPSLETDPQRLRQLLLALLSNAVKYTCRGRVRIEVSLRDEPDASPDAGTYSLFPDPMLQLLVIDTGPGIPAGARERIFDAFEQLGDPARSHSMTRGTGLGLTMARQLSLLLGGQLYLADTSEAGSCFCLCLPLAFAGPSS